MVVVLVTCISLYYIYIIHYIILYVYYNCIIIFTFTFQNTSVYCKFIYIIQNCIYFKNTTFLSFYLSLLACLSYRNVQEIFLSLIITFPCLFLLFRFIFSQALTLWMHSESDCIPSSFLSLEDCSS